VPKDPPNDTDGRPVEDLVVPMRLSSEYGELNLLYTTTVCGSPRDVTLDELAIETIFPADPRTAKVLQAMSASRE
jgi:hypothetical protein